LLSVQKVAHVIQQEKTKFAGQHGSIGGGFGAFGNGGGNGAAMSTAMSTVMGVRGGGVGRLGVGGGGGGGGALSTLPPLPPPLLPDPPTPKPTSTPEVPTQWGSLATILLRSSGDGDDDGEWVKLLVIFTSTTCHHLSHEFLPFFFRFLASPKFLCVSLTNLPFFCRQWKRSLPADPIRPNLAGRHRFTHPRPLRSHVHKGWFRGLFLLRSLPQSRSTRVGSLLSLDTKYFKQHEQQQQQQRGER
jgi:hypothetical protein